MKRGLKGGISIDADSSPPRYVLWCCGDICHQPGTFIQIGSGHTVQRQTWFFLQSCRVTLECSYKMGQNIFGVAFAFLIYVRLFHAYLSYLFYYFWYSIFRSFSDLCTNLLQNISVIYGSSLWTGIVLALMLTFASIFIDWADWGKQVTKNDSKFSTKTMTMNMPFQNLFKYFSLVFLVLQITLIILLEG